jgi:hypothetical protein
MSDRTVRDLTKARDKIAHSWIQGAEISEGPEGKVGYCSIGAIRFSILEEAFEHRLENPNVICDRVDADAAVLALAIDELHPELEGNYDIVDFNDCESRTQEEVLEVFDRAIKIAERDDL